jgi:hypothetical protein
VQIAGEHEDYYDEDFCIYNDVFVHEPDCTIRIYGYPQAQFPPTDFHTATLIGEHIYLIGSLGYAGTRQYGTTPVYRLDTRSFRMERLNAGGDAPGWIYKHRTTRWSEYEICIQGGTVVTRSNGQEAHVNNDQRFLLDVRRMVWSAQPSI